MIRTPRLQLVPATVTLVQADLQGREALQQTIGVDVPESWPPELFDHDALPTGPLVAAVPVSVRAEDQRGQNGNQVSVMVAALPTHLHDPVARAEAMGASMADGRFARSAPGAVLPVPLALLQTDESRV